MCHCRVLWCLKVGCYDVPLSSAMMSQSRVLWCVTVGCYDVVSKSGAKMCHCRGLWCCLKFGCYDVSLSGAMMLSQSRVLWCVTVGGYDVVSKSGAMMCHCRVLGCCLKVGCYDVSLSGAMMCHCPVLCCVPQNRLHTRKYMRKFLFKIRSMPVIVFEKQILRRKKLTRFTTLEELISQRTEIQKQWLQTGKQTYHVLQH